MIKKKIVIINGHPDNESFSFGLAEAYKRYIVGFNFFQQDTLRLIFFKGADAKDATGLLKGDYKDGRRIISYTSIADVKKTEAALKKIIKQLLKLMDK